jgi:hypothetical protein
VQRLGVYIQPQLCHHKGSALCGGRISQTDSHQPHQLLAMRPSQSTATNPICTRRYRRSRIPRAQYQPPTELCVRSKAPPAAPPWVSASSSAALGSATLTLLQRVIYSLDVRSTAKRLQGSHRGGTRCWPTEERSTCPGSQEAPFSGVMQASRRWCTAGTGGELSAEQGIIRSPPPFTVEGSLLSLPYGLYEPPWLSDPLPFARCGVWRHEGWGAMASLEVEVSNDAVVEYTWISGALKHAR